MLARHFPEVIATDSSEAQLRHAAPAAGVTYAATAAESAALRAGSVDLVTVAQALHWFDLSRFYTEVDRVLSEGGVIAVWTYGLLSIGPEMDHLVGHLYRDILGSYWPAERALVDSGYAGIAFPFEELHVPRFEMEAWWTLAQLGAYLDTWSAVTQYRRAHVESPIASFLASMAPFWGPTDVARRVTWPLEIRAGRRRA
jgi:SAM-dependent methyltransferase